jgi:hypothetical protein
LSLRGRPSAVWLGAATAFAVHVAIAVTIGAGLFALLPHRRRSGRRDPPHSGRLRDVASRSLLLLVVAMKQSLLQPGSALRGWLGQSLRSSGDRGFALPAVPAPLA